jgi:hypothetical protein
VINADDFYGKDAFQKAHEFLVTGCSEKRFSLIGYELIKTLSEHGSVSRGVCEVDGAGFLVAINERTKIYRENGRILYEENGQRHEVPAGSAVSMNFWCFHPSVFSLSEGMFHEFLAQQGGNPKSEFFIPLVGDRFIRMGYGKISVIPTASQWFGVTYKEDAPGVEKNLMRLIEQGEYPERLWT